MKYLVGIDIGTQGTRAILFDERATDLARCYRPYPIHTPHPGWAEQDPDEILAATADMIRQLLHSKGLTAKDVAGVGMSSVLLSLTAIDARGRPLMPLTLWADSRGLDEVHRLAATGVAHEFFLKTTCKLHPLYPLSRVLWIKTNRSDIFREADKLVSIKEYLMRRWFGRNVVDASVASATGYLNIRDLRWDQDILRTIGLPEGKLSEVVDGLTVFDGLLPEWAARTGLSAKTPFVIGAGDGPLANLGVGALSPEKTVSTIGTTAAVRATTRDPVVDEKERIWTYALADGYWVTGGALNNGSLVLKWFHDALDGARPAEEASFEAYDSLASSLPPGAGGLVFLPFLTGERCPGWNARARGVLFGLRLEHGRGNIVRAMMEGVIYRLYAVFRVLSELVPASRPNVIASGGYSGLATWPQIQADVFGRDILIPKTGEASARGAAILAMKATGIIKDYGEIETPIESQISPRAENVEAYARLYALAERLYSALQEGFEEIHRL